MDAPQILTIGHSNYPIERFLELLQGAGVRALADVRSFPVSRYAPQFNREALAKALAEKAIAYLYCGKDLGGRLHERPSTPADLSRGLDHVVAESAHRRIALMCAERDPVNCHRLLLARALIERGIAVGHILASGEIASQRAIEDRLLAQKGLAGDDLFPREERLSDVYRARRARRTARADPGFTRDRHEADTSRKHPTCEAE
ncbi:MAG TPA: DUF488 domain-containing protein [Xanthobacteraceae bacterium]|nr:DUF488 domain-containing protein [Xanthobacteraceae bacterium]